MNSYCNNDNNHNSNKNNKYSYNNKNNNNNNRENDTDIILYDSIVWLQKDNKNINFQNYENLSPVLENCQNILA